MEIKSDECVAVDESEISESYADQFETAYDVVINWTTSSKDHKVIKIKQFFDANYFKN
jgi:hypothetical protein